MAIYDCFTFFNELELLEIRLSELDGSVDYFVICEARQTHSGQSKPLYFKKNKKRFEKWSKKIIYIAINLPKLSLLDRFLITMEKTILYTPARWITINFGLGRWKLENFQRCSIRNGLKNAKDSDIIMVSDLDEIPNPKKIRVAIDYARKGKVIKFKQKLFYYYINGASSQIWTGTKMCTYAFLRKGLENNPQYLRVPRLMNRVIRKIFNKKSDTVYIENGGWHFSYLGGVEKIKRKRMAIAHTEVSSEKLIRGIDIERDIEKGVFKTKDINIDINYIDIDKTFPKTIIKNKNKYSHLINK